MYKKEKKDSGVIADGSRLRGYYNALDALTNIKFFKDLYYTETLDALGHNEETIPGFEVTCSQSGLTDSAYCTRCETIVVEHEEIPAVGHYVWTTGTEWIDSYSVVNDSAYPFTYSDGWYTSSNHDHPSTSTFTINALYDCTLVLAYSVSSESSYDYLKIYHNGSSRDSISGTVSGKQYTFSLAAGDVVTITYSKDGSASYGTDTGSFKIVSCTQIEIETLVRVSAYDVEPTCNQAVVCDSCHQTIKEALTHNYVDGVCEHCGSPDKTNPDDGAEAILKAAYALASGATLEGTHTLTGVVTNVEKTGEGEACLTFVVEGYEEYPMYCYWLKGEAAGTLAVGDTITVTGTIKNYNGTVEYDKPTLDSFVKGEAPDDGGNTGDIELSDASVVIPAAYALASGATLEGTHTLKGQIISSGGLTSYNDISVTIVVEGYEDYPIYCYQIKNDADKIDLGDIITVQGTIKNYKGTVEFDKPTLLAYEEGTLEPSIDVTPTAGTGIAEGYQVITIEQAKAIATVTSGVTAERYYIHATVSTIMNYNYGEMYVEDATGSMYVFGTYSADGNTTYSAMESKAYKGDEVLIYCTLKNYNGALEINNARLIDFKAVEIDDTDYAVTSIDDAREANVGDKLKVTGIVAQITYASGMVPNGIYLVDNENSIYVYDSDIAGRVSVGNTITILAEKAWWILDSESASAEKFGYKGCNQLDNAWLVANDNGNTTPNYNWAEETTVKAIMETPVTTDITTTIYKVTALVKKSVGADYINYYIDDLDETTGSYVYTQCNGSDLGWLEQFDGKVCDVYLSVINAKSTSSGCVWRFKVLKVEDNNFVFDTAKAPQFAIDYYAADQFATEYTADPAIEVVKTVSSALLGFENVTVSYASSNTNVIYFENGVMHTGTEYGVANVTITATLNGATATKVIAIEYKKQEEIPSITVAEAIATAPKTEITVKGIVGPSVVNQPSAFYLFGEDGSMIAVSMNSADTLKSIEIGQEIIIKGMRTRRMKNETATTYFGQTCIAEAELLANNMGNHAYSTAKFVTGKTSDDLYTLDAKVDHSTTVFVVTGILTVPSGNSQPSIKSAGATNAFSFYCSGAGQYAFLAAYSGQEVTLEIAACNWNGKTYWRGCVLAIRLANGTKVVNTLNFNN